MQKPEWWYGCVRRLVVMQQSGGTYTCIRMLVGVQQNGGWRAFDQCATGW